MNRTLGGSLGIALSLFLSAACSDGVGPETVAPGEGFVFGKFSTAKGFEIYVMLNSIQATDLYEIRVVNESQTITSGGNVEIIVTTVAGRRKSD